jgi:hypothetical protein
MKIRPVGAEFFRAGGQIDTHTYILKLTVAFGNFANAPNCSKRGYGSFNLLKPSGNFTYHHV